MEPIPYDVGRVVQSIQGRDRKRYFIVTAEPEGDFLLLSDGMTRKLDHPKKKKIKHVRPRPLRMENYQSLQAENRLKDSDLRTFLTENGLGPEQPLCKED